MKKCMLLFTVIFSLGMTFALETCPSAVTNDPYPGECGQYIDKDGNSFCDLGETTSGSTQNSGSHQGQDACDSNLATGELTSTQMKAMNVEQLANAFNIDLSKAIEKISTRAGFAVQAGTAIQDIHDRAQLPMKEMRSLLQEIQTPTQAIVNKTSSIQQKTIGQTIIATMQSMHVGVFILFLLLLIVLFFTRNIKNKLFNKIKTIDANIMLLYIPILGFSQHFLFPDILPEAIHRGYLGFRTLWLLLIARPIANILIYYKKQNGITKFFTRIISKRKQIGITMFWFALLHGLTRNITWLGLGMVKDMLFLSLMGVFGLIALLATLVAFLTSNKKSMIYFGRSWKKIQQITYISITFAVAHIYFVNSERGIVVIGLFVLRAMLRLTARKLRKNQSK